MRRIAAECRRAARWVSRPGHVVVLVAALATARPAAAQRLELGVRVGHAAVTGPEFVLANSGDSARVWDRDGVTVGAGVTYWLGRHVGVRGTADFQFARHRAAWSYFGPCCVPIPAGPGDRDSAVTNVAASLRLAARFAPVGRVEVGFSAGPALVHLGEQSDASTYAFVHTDVVGAAGGVTLAWAPTRRLRLGLSADELLYRVRPADPALFPGFWTTVSAPIQRQLTLGVTATVTAH
ncbi:MAG TPA: hypothetical protein VMT77_11265 [Gemmatimonadales bacterium]|nr:hypothetical protein [Gemmatimonadales bacterium]